MQIDTIKKTYHLGDKPDAEKTLAVDLAFFMAEVLDHFKKIGPVDQVTMVVEFRWTGR